jgi:SPP1 gp7 family putative phage head morphogenesis protein
MNAALKLRQKALDDISKAQQHRIARERFNTASKLENEYLRSLRYLTRQIDQIVKTMAPAGDLSNSVELQKVLRDYSRTITPWAKSVAEKMIYRIAKKDEQSWSGLGLEVSRNLRREIETAPTGMAFRKFLEESVHYITDLPNGAAERIQELTVESMYNSQRASEVAKKVMETGSVTASRAKTIARTEIARVSSGITEVRALHVGCTHYVWRTSADGDVRPSHKVMNGQVIAFANPPEVDPGKFYHAGQFVNCRCYISPILPDME